MVKYGGGLDLASMVQWIKSACRLPSESIEGMAGIQAKLKDEEVLFVRVGGDNSTFEEYYKFADKI